MTTLEHYPGLGGILRQLDSVQTRRRTIRLATGAATFAAIAMASLLVALPAAGYWPGQPPAMLRWALLVGLVLLWSAAAVRYIVRPALWHQNSAQTARFVEQALPEMRNDLINSILLGTDRDQISPELVSQAIRESARHTRRTPLARSVSLRSLHRWCVAAAVAALLAGTMGIFQGDPMKRGLMAIVNPLGYVATQGTVEILSVEPGDATRFAGEQVSITAAVRNEDASDLPAEVLIAGLDEPRAMIASLDGTAYACSLGQVSQDIEYAVRVGDTRWPLEKPYYKISVLKRVRIEGLDIEYAYPPYTKLDNTLRHNAQGPIEAPLGTQATVTLRLAAPVSTVVMETRSGEAIMMRPSANGRQFATVFTVARDDAYRLIVRDSRGHTLQQLPDVAAAGALPTAGTSRVSGYYRIRATDDAAPRVEFTAPNQDVSSPPGSTVAVSIKASDNFGLEELKLQAEIESTGRNILTHSFNVKGRAEAIASHVIPIPANYGDDGSVVIVYYATATDNRNLPGIGGPQTTSSGRFKITVENADRISAEKAERFDELRSRLMAILRLQEAQKVSTLVAAKTLRQLLSDRDKGQDVPSAPQELLAGGRGILAAQRKIKAQMIDLVDNFPFDPEMATIQQALALLATNEAQAAIDQAQVLADVLAAMQNNGDAFGLLGRTQDKIIDTLRTLLAVMPSLADRPGRKDESRPGEDIPPEAREKLEKLKQGLEEFVEAERKAIQAGSRLAKKPVDSFTNEDEQLLRKLTAAQDKWEKFLNEAFTDFSKLAQQDFANPTTMKELISVKSDITMAKDALTKKTVEVATPMEENAVENAKSLTANLEKWLAEKPDREKWVMEEMDEQENIEMPELPSELEDLVGDLLEEEKDLFEEAADVTSKHTASGDKGIGWEAADGPISNMNAQGVTGNQLPNPTEISGRSGEGRQGKSSGEFVEDKAVGKGGRRTPTRLTPEPFMKGQVNDVSEEAAGGSTGGGKISGSGTDGLEGPLPPPLKEALKGLAAKQASIINKAERLRERFGVANYAGFKMVESIILMNRVRSDLENYRYQNVLRQRETVLDTMRQVKVHTRGGIDVSADTTMHMPKYVRDDVADAMKGKMPEEYREVLEQYYRRLSQTSQE